MQSAALLREAAAELPRALARHPAEHRGEVARRAVAGGDRDLGDGAPGAGEQLLGPLDPLADLVLMGRHAHRAAEGAAEMGRAETGQRRQLVEGDVALEIVVDELAHRPALPAGKAAALHRGAPAIAPLQPR